MKRLIITAALTAFATVAGATDSWTGKDKAAHAGGSSALSAGVTAVAGNEFVGIAAALLVGAAKEGYDSKHPDKHTASWKDFAADAAGALIGAKLGGVVIAPDRRGIVVGFQRVF